MMELLAVIALAAFVAFLVFAFRASLWRASNRPGNNAWCALACLVLAITSGNVVANAPALRAVNASTAAPRQRGWLRKAVPSARLAAREVGGFSNDDARAYKNGLAHIRNAHETLGRYTIALVVDQEKQRESNRMQVQLSANKAAQDAEDDRVAKAREAAELANAKIADHRAAAARAAEENTMHGEPECLTMSRGSVDATTDDIDAVSVTGVIKNGCGRDFRYAQVEVSFYKDDGTTQVTNGLDNLANFEAGNTWSFKALAMNAGGGRYRVTKIIAY